jgi:transposase
LLRILLIGYLYGITSERKLVEELRMHLAWRWFTGLGFDQEIPHHFTFSKNRHSSSRAWRHSSARTNLVSIYASRLCPEHCDPHETANKCFWYTLF